MPAAAYVDIPIERDRDVTITLTLVDEEGVPVNLTAAGTKFYFTVKRRRSDTYDAAVVKKVYDRDTPANTSGIAVGVSNDKAVVDIYAADTKGIKRDGDFYYDGYLIYNGRHSTVVKGSMPIEPVVSDP